MFRPLALGGQRGRSFSLKKIKKFGKGRGAVVLPDIGDTPTPTLRHRLVFVRKGRYFGKRLVISGNYRIFATSFRKKQ